jgi:hypothetical protein
VRWTDIDARFPDPAPMRGVPGRFSTELRTAVAAIATHATRRALDLPTAPIARESILGVIASATEDRYLLRESWAGVLALIAALEKDWDAVAACTGRRALGARVIVDKTFGGDITSLARHLATAARAQLPARQVLAAMHDLRAQLATGTFDDPRGAVLAARLFVTDIVAAPEPVSATRAWLAGEDIEIVDSRPVRAVADGEDPRVKIFERYAGELGDDAAIDRELVRLAPADGEPWARYHHAEREPFEDAAIRAWMARRPMLADWEAFVDPTIACFLDVESRASISVAQRFLDLAPRRFVSSGPPPPFKPGKFFKDDLRKLTQYLDTAVLVGASAGDVEPAWLDFLARRSPATTTVGGQPLRWKSLLWLQSTITHQLGKLPREQTGAALRRIVTGI